MSDQNIDKAARDFSRAVDKLTSGAAGARGETYRDYEAWCAEQKLRPLPVEQFAEALKRVCDAAGVRIQRKGGTAYLIGLRLAQQDVESASA
jgi:hypothetical protein